MTGAPSATRRYLALWFPFLPADRWRIARGACSPPDAPFAFVAKVKGALRLAAVDPAAHALGLAPGLGLADARAQLPGLEAIEHDPAADRRWLERLAEGCVRYTPMVALDPPDGLVLDITGCAHLFGGEAGLAADAEARLERLGMTVRGALASSADAAHALARHGTGGAADEAAAIRRLPVAALRLDAEAELALRRAGLKTVGEVADRPASALAARFGEPAVAAFRRLVGEAESPLAPRRLLPRVVAERRFAEPIARTEHVLEILAELLAEATGELERREAGGRRFDAVLVRADGLARALAVETGRPTRDPEAVMRLFRERIETLDDPLDPGFGFDLVRLGVSAAEPLAPAQLELEGGSVGETEIVALIDRLSTRLGRSRLRCFRPRDTHIPEQVQLELPAVEARAPAEWNAARRGEPPMRPLHLFDPPQPIEVIAEVPDGPPHRFRWRRDQHEVVRYEGPERIASEWWRRKDDPLGKGGLTRDYYRVEDARGRRFWVFRHGLFGSEKANPRWYLHGLFA